MRSRDVQYLNVYKSKKVWVAVDSESNSPFVWWVYDDELMLMATKQQIIWSARYGNGGKYLMAFLSGLSIAHFLYVLGVGGVWNKFFIRGGGDENRES